MSPTIIEGRFLLEGIMQKLKLTLSLLLLMLPALARAAFCSEITGEVRGPHGPVAGAQIFMTDPTGKVVAETLTDQAGHYCISGLTPGSYKSTVKAPASAGFKTGAVGVDLREEGATGNWLASSSRLALALIKYPGACGAFARLPLWVPVGIAEAGLGIGAAAAAGAQTGSEQAVPVISGSR
jgi:hypothetical protein